MKLLSSLVLTLSFLVLSSFSSGPYATVPSVDVKTLEGKDAINEIYADWQEQYDMELLAVTIDDARSMAKVPALVETKGWEYTILADSKRELQKALNFQTVPQTFLIDAEGNIVYTHSGYNPGDEIELEDKIAELAGK